MNDGSDGAMLVGGAGARAGAALDASSDSDKSSTSVDVDMEWHTDKGLPYVAVDQVFEIQEEEGKFAFLRTAKREATCVNCERLFGSNSYHKRALKAHGIACAAKVVRRAKSVSNAAACADWSGNLSCAHSFGGDTNVTVVFQKILDADSGARGAKCGDCGDLLKVVSERHLTQHVMAKHKPEAVKQRERIEKVASKLAQKRETTANALGAKGRAAMSTFLAASQRQGQANKEARSQNHTSVRPTIQT
jgi:hypothetical protein